MRAVVGLPGVGLPLRLRALGKDGIEAGERGELVGMQRVGGEIDLRGLVDGGVAHENRAGMQRGGQAGVAAGAPRQLARLRAVDEVELLLGAFEAERQLAAVGQQSELLPRAVKRRAQPLDFAADPDRCGRGGPARRDTGLPASPTPR